jgi:hypothetical protein
MKIAIVATSMLLATAMPATAGHYGGGAGPDWGAVGGAGILGALFGAATVPQPQPQIIVVVPQQPVYIVPPQPVYASPAPTYAPPSGRPAWCSGVGRIWSPATKTCVAE